MTTQMASGMIRRCNVLVAGTGQGTESLLSRLVFFVRRDYVLPRNKEAVCLSSRGKECWI